MLTDMREKAKRIINRRGLGALANNTKWGEFFKEVALLDVTFEFKLIDDDDTVIYKRIWCPVSNYIEGQCMGPYPFYWVEWVRISETRKTPVLVARVGLECVVGESCTTVYGYR
jgi:hypothetical protein